RNAERVALAGDGQVVAKAGQGSYSGSHPGSNASPEGEVVPHLLAATRQKDDVADECPGEEANGDGDEHGVDRMARNGKLAFHRTLRDAGFAAGVSARLVSARRVYGGRGRHSAVLLIPVWIVDRSEKCKRWNLLGVFDAVCATASVSQRRYERWHRRSRIRESAPFDGALSDGSRRRRNRME